MKIKFLIPFCLLFALISCEDDDICVGNGTPNLTVVFRNSLNTANLKDTLSIYSSLNENFENQDTIFEKIFTDSIKLQLNGLNTNQTYFKIKRRSNANSDILSVGYNPESEYVSKACGFRIVYKNLEYSITQQHVSYLIPAEENELTDETTTNLTIVLAN